MKITRVESFRLQIPVKPERVITSSLGTHRESEYVIVRLTTDEGIVGAGEATVMPRWSGETATGAKAIIDDLLGPAVIGGDPCDALDVDARLDEVCRHNWFAKAAVEMACWDIHGKSRSLPVYELLGGAKRPLAIRSRYSMGAYDPDYVRRRARELVELGFTTIKIKVGHDADKSIERVRAVREEVGPAIDLVIDANCGFDADAAIYCVNSLADCRLSLVEQPTPDGDYAAIARVRREVEPPVMADDMCFDLVHARELIRNDGCDVISVYPGKNGGIRKTQAIVELAGQHGVACSIGSNLEWDLATAAMCHLAVACENIQIEKFPGDILGPDYHQQSIAKNPISIEGPITTITDQPGLGIDVDWDLVTAGGKSV